MLKIKDLPLRVGSFQEAQYQDSVNRPVFAEFKCNNCGEMRRLRVAYGIHDKPPLQNCAKCFDQTAQQQFVHYMIIPYEYVDEEVA